MKSNMHSVPLFLILLLHVLILSTEEYFYPGLHDLTPYTSMYYLLFCFSITFYIIASTKDPGILPQLKPVQVRSADQQSVDFTNNSGAIEAKKSIELHSKELEDENSGPISVSVFGENPIISEADEEEPKIPEGTKQTSIFIEPRFCSICLIEQPLRAKHCRDCNRCIALYDHHCPWLGNCIGERNRFYFWWYLLFECGLLVWSFGILLGTLREKHEFWGWVKANMVVVGCLIVVGGFLLLVGFLLAFHSYLAMSNKTTWEQLSWAKISYLNKWPKRAGSPFNIGVVNNLKYYCWKKLPDGHTVWNFHSSVPELTK